MSEKYEKLKRSFGLIVYVAWESVQRYEKNLKVSFYGHTLIIIGAIIFAQFITLSLVIWGASGPINWLYKIPENLGLFESEYILINYLGAGFVVLLFYFIPLILFPYNYISNLNPNLKELEMADSHYVAVKNVTFIMLISAMIMYWNDISIF
jgi:hypothetical protein